jgi:pyruvate dehydrogenase E2 component (dihydrolipoamide acetyltransferase)
MPALSPTMEEGKLAKWLVKEGDVVKSGTILAEIETDKATMEFEAVDEGTIGKILVAEGSEGVKVNAPIAVLLAEGEKAGAAVDIPAAMKDIKAAVEAEEKSSAPAPKADAPKAAAAPAKNDGARIYASPLAKRIAAELRDWVGREIGPIAKPKEIRFGDNLPKTRSGKIMRRLLRSLAKGEEITQDVSTLENPGILEQLKQAT